MTPEQIVALVLGSGTVGAILKSVIDWYLARGDKRVSREDAIAAANDRVAAELREELRKENLALRERLSKVEGRTDELSKTNAALRDENTILTKQNASQAAQIAHMQKEIENLQGEVARRPGTGPLAAAT